MCFWLKNQAEVNKINKPLVRLLTEKMEEVEKKKEEGEEEDTTTQITSMKGERDITTDPTVIRKDTKGIL